MPGLGHKSYIQIGTESTYGTAVTPNQRLEFISCNVAPVVGVIQDPSMNNAQSRRALYQGGLLYRGSIVVRANYEGLNQFFRAAFGSGVSATVDAGPPVTRSHTFKEASSLPSLTIEVIEGDVDAGKCFKLVGAKVTGFTIRGSAGTGTDAMLQVEFQVLAKDKLSNQTPTTPTVTGLTISSLRTVTRASGSWYTDGIGVGSTVTGANFAAGATVTSVTSATVLTVDRDCTNGAALSGTFTLAPMSLFPILYHQALVIDDGTADAAANVRVRSFEVTLESPHTEDRFYLGSVNIDEPLRSDFLTARFRLTQEFTTRTQFDAAKAFTSGSPRLVFQHPTIIAGSVRREFEVRANQANLVEFSVPVDGYGVLISTATWEAFYDPTDAAALVARFQNTDQAIV